MPNAVTPDRYAVNRQYKSSIFAMLFGGEKSCWNCTTPSTAPAIPTVAASRQHAGNAIYLGLKNDVSFLIDVRLHLYEHQSTWNPNMPLRNLFYVSDQHAI